MLRIRKRCAEIVGVEVEPGTYASEQYQREKFGERESLGTGQMWDWSDKMWPANAPRAATWIRRWFSGRINGEKKASSSTSWVERGFV
jgi:hypothetical protein